HSLHEILHCERGLWVSWFCWWFGRDSCKVKPYYHYRKNHHNQDGYPSPDSLPALFNVIEQGRLVEEHQQGNCCDNTQDNQKCPGSPDCHLHICGGPILQKRYQRGNQESRDQPAHSPRHLGHRPLLWCLRDGCHFGSSRLPPLRPPK